MRYGLPNACSVLCAVGFAAVQASSASAQGAGSEAGAAASYSFSVPSSSASSSSAHKAAFRHHGAERNRSWSAADEPYIGHGVPQWRYFVELRARNAASYGHMYVMYGEVNDRQEIIRSEIAGFYPAGDKQNCLNCSVYNWTVGHVVPVPSEIGASDGDLEQQYVTARFRVWIDAAQYQRLVAYIGQRKANKTPWHALFNNCVTFGRDVAVFMNLKVPPLAALSPSVMMYPQTLVNMLREANGVEKEQAPLKDASGSLPGEVVPKVRGAGSPQPPAKNLHATSNPEKPAADEGKMASSTIH
jgi:hypothetical protein